jgi:cell division protein FtsB
MIDTDINKEIFMLKHFFPILFIIALTFSVSGCDDKSSEIAALQEQVTSLQKENDELKKQNTDLKEELAIFVNKHKEDTARAAKPKFDTKFEYKGVNRF